MTGKFCCPRCFAHPWLQEYVTENKSKDGRCSYCRSSKLPLIMVGELEGHLKHLIDRYEPFLGEPFTSGEPLLFLVQEFGVFDEDRMDEATMGTLLEDILNSGWDDDSGDMPVQASDLYMERGSPWHSSHADLWGEFCFDTLKNPEAPLPFHEYFEENFELSSATLTKGSVFYRARLGFDEDSLGNRLPYSGSDIGAPPPEKATSGRANRNGRPVLYCACEEKTAIAEKRPATGLLVSVCSLELNRDIKILDLTMDIEPPNPFPDETLAYTVEIQELMFQLGEDMGHPLERNEDTSLYVPCQRLAEFIEQAGYGGICYPSALNEAGKNLVLFDPLVADIRPSKLVKIVSVTINYEEKIGSRPA